MPSYKKRFSGQAKLRRLRSAAGVAGGMTRAAPGYSRVNPLLDPGAQARQMQAIGADSVMHQQFKIQNEQQAREAARLNLAGRDMTLREDVGRGGLALREREGDVLYGTPGVDGQPGTPGIRQKESESVINARTEGIQLDQDRFEEFKRQFDAGRTDRKNERTEDKEERNKDRAFAKQLDDIQAGRASAKDRREVAVRLAEKYTRYSINNAMNDGKFDITKLVEKPIKTKPTVDELDSYWDNILARNNPAIPVGMAKDGETPVTKPYSEANESERFNYRLKNIIGPAFQSGKVDIGGTGQPAINTGGSQTPKVTAQPARTASAKEAELINQMIALAQGGDPDAIKNLKQLGVDWRGNLDTRKGLVERTR